MFDTVVLYILRRKLANVELFKLSV